MDFNNVHTSTNLLNIFRDRKIGGGVVFMGLVYILVAANICLASHICTLSPNVKIMLTYKTSCDFSVLDDTINNNVDWHGKRNIVYQHNILLSL